MIAAAAKGSLEIASSRRRDGTKLLGIRRAAQHEQQLPFTNGRGTVAAKQQQQQNCRSRYNSCCVMLACVLYGAAGSLLLLYYVPQQQQQQQQGDEPSPPPPPGFADVWNTITNNTSSKKTASRLIVDLQARLQAEHGGGGGGSSVVEPCQWLPSRSEDDNRRIQSLCDDERSSSSSSSESSSLLIYHNPLPQHERYLCDGTTKIEGGAFVAVEKLKCTEPPRLFPATPELDAHGMPPVILKFGNRGGRPGTLFEGCNVPCLSYGTGSIAAERTVEAIDKSEWTITFSMEGEQYYPSLKIDPTGWKSNHFWSTTSYQSEVPLPYYSRAEYNINSTAVDYDTAIKGAVFLARNCGSMNNREGLVKKLQQSDFRVDSLSDCLKNARPPPGVDLENKVKVMQQYLFYLAFENQCTKDYMTEKLWGPFEAGTVPIYFGAPNVKDHVPNHSIIFVNDFNTTDALVQHLLQVASDRELYESYHKWRTRPLPPHFVRRYDMTDTHSTCRTCRWAYARQYGWGWNHTSQQLRELLSGPRRVCLDNSDRDDDADNNSNSSGLIRQPFSEMWKNAAGVDVSVSSISSSNRTSTARDDDSCELTDDNRVVRIDNGRVRRTVRYQDGVTDLLIERGISSSSSSSSSDDLLLLQIRTPLTKATIKAVREGVWHVQNEVTRYTVLTAPSKTNVTASTGADGVVEVWITAVPLRVRVIVEDVDTFHQGADTEENFFGKLMADDFFNPLEVFVQIFDRPKGARQ